MRLSKTFFRQIIVFGMVGGAATIGYAVGVWLLVRQLGWSPVVASLVSYILCAVFSFLAHSLLTFQVGKGTPRDLVRFIVTTVIGLSLAAGAMKASEMMGFPLPVGIAIVVMAIPLTNFLVLKYWVFERR